MSIQHSVPISVRIIAPGRDFRYQAKHPIDMAEVLTSHGYRVELLAPMPPKVVAIHAGRGFRIVPLPPLLSHICPQLASAEMLGLSLLRGMPRVDVTIGVDPPGFMVAHLLKRLGRTRLLVYYAIELCLPEETPRQETVRYQARNIRDADLIITTGEHRAKVMEERFRLSKLPMVVHNSFVLTEAVANPCLRETLVERGFHPTEHLVIYHGGLSEGNAIPQIMQSVADWLPQAGLVLIGFGDPGFIALLPSLAREFSVADRVFYFGTIPPGSYNLFRLTAGASLGLVLKTYRSKIMNDVYYTPGKLLEYAAMGLPVICSDQVSLRFVEDEGWGLCVDPEEPCEIAGAVNEILSNPQRRAQMGATARRMFEEKYHFEKQLETVLAHLQELLTGQLAEAWS